MTCAFGTIYLFTSELFPTRLRTGGVGLASTFARVGAILSPYVAMADKVAHWLPLVLFGAAAAVSGLLCHALLPETLGKELPSTIREAIHLGDDDDDEDTSASNNSDRSDLRLLVSVDEENQDEDEPLLDRQIL